MKPAVLIILMSASLAAAQGTIINASAIDHLLVLQKVYVNGDGPFRMMVDTGNASSLVRPSIARKLGLHRTGWLQQGTAATDRPVPAAWLDEVQVGNVIDKTVEVMIADVKFSGVDGVLGQSWLVRHDYLLDYRNHRLVIDGEAPKGGVRAALRSPDGRPAVVAEVSGRGQELIIDSGAHLLVLFERPLPVRQLRLLTNSDSVVAQGCSAMVAIGDGYRRRMATAKVSAPRPSPGLLPAGAFSSVYVSNREGIVVLIP